MNKSAAEFLISRNAELPKSARTRSGITYSPLASGWAFRDGNQGISMNFNLVPTLADPLIHGMKLTLIWYLENRAPSTAENNFDQFLSMLKHLTEARGEQIVKITAEDILAFKMMSKKTEHVLARLRGFMRQWVKIGAPGIGENVITLLDQLKLKQSPIGVAVATLDSKEGPLTDLEFESIQCALTDAYADGKINEEIFFLAFLFMALGARPVQFSGMKLCDLISPKSDAEGDYILMVPRAKQHEHISRDELKKRVLARQLGEPLKKYVSAVYAQFADRLVDPWQAPLFPQVRQIDKANALGFEYHRTPSSIAQIVISAFKRLSVPSERLSGSMPITPIRFRRTFATRAAEEGLPLLVIAEMMDHANTQNVEVYAGLTSRIRALSNSVQNFPDLGWKQRPIVSTPVCNDPAFKPGKLECFTWTSFTKSADAIRCKNNPSRPLPARWDYPARPYANISTPLRNRNTNGSNKPHPSWGNSKSS